MDCQRLKTKLTVSATAGGARTFLTAAMYFVNSLLFGSRCGQECPRAAVLALRH